MKPRTKTSGITHPFWKVTQTLCLFFTVLIPAIGQGPEVEHGLIDRFEKESHVDVIVSFHESSVIDYERDIDLTKAQKGGLVFDKLQSSAARSQSEIKQYMQKYRYAFKSFCIANCIQVLADEKLFSYLQTNPSVKSISLNDVWQMQTILNGSPSFQRNLVDSIPWGLALVNADQVWAMGFRGQGAVVGGHDTGVEWDHPALISSYRGWDGFNADHNYHWHDAVHAISPLHQDSILTDSTNPCGLSIDSPCDDISSSHGTHTMGIMIGKDPSAHLTVGMAPDAKWIGVRNMERGYGTLSSYLEGLEWFLAPTDLNGQNPRPELAPHVINNSWSCPDKEGCNKTNFHLLEVAINNLRSAGIVVVASAGNSGRDGCGSIDRPPAFYEGTMTVGSIDDNDSLSTFSSRGPAIDYSSNLSMMKPNVTAPGRDILSSVKGGLYKELSGTSMAGPHVAGLVAILISANPSLSGRVDLIEHIIEASAQPKFETDSCSRIVDQLPNALHGFGRIDALAAVRLALMTTRNIESGTSPPHIYPNPANDFLFVEIPHSFKSDEVSIYSMDGLLQKSISLDKNEGTITINVRELRSGIYYFQAGRIWSKFIIQR